MAVQLDGSGSIDSIHGAPYVTWDNRCAVFSPRVMEFYIYGPRMMKSWLREWLASF